MSLRSGLLWLTQKLAPIIQCLSWNNIYIFEMYVPPKMSSYPRLNTADLEDSSHSPTLAFPRLWCRIRLAGHNLRRRLLGHWIGKWCMVAIGVPISNLHSSSHGILHNARGKSAVFAVSIGTNDGRDLWGYHWAGHFHLAPVVSLRDTPSQRWTGPIRTNVKPNNVNKICK
jgi:hypothetical protein